MKDGERWFWYTLLDADIASNVGNWQYIAGSGTDPAPYFRIFNPELQSQKYDPNGDYIRKWVPELKNLPKEYIHNPSLAPLTVLKNAGVELGVTYPKPMVDHKKATEKAKKEWERLSKK